MSVEITIKREPDPEFPNGSSEELSNEPEPPTISQVEFVNIKTEAQLEVADIVVKREVDNEYPGVTTLWPSPDVPRELWHSVAVKSETSHCEQNQQRIEITVKPELDDYTENNCQEYPYDLTLRSNHDEPNTSKYDSYVTEEALNEYSTADGKFMCHICHKRFANKGNVQRHIVLHSREKLQCAVCAKQYHNKEQYEKHVTKHTNEKRYKCEECDKRFRTSSNLEQHKRVHLSVKPFYCDVCQRGFSIKANLVKHQGKTRCKKPVDEPIVCKVCNKTFQKEFLLKSHLRRHNDEKPYSCETCKMNFKYKSTVIRHIQLHNGLKPYSCKICGKNFTHAGLIKPHMRIHTGEKPYQCPVCEKLFAHKHNMNRHRLRHNKVKRLVCEICSKQFPRESRLKYHMRTHTKEKPFTCYVCYKNFSHKQNVLRHYSRKHPNDTYCPAGNPTQNVDEIHSSEAEEILG